MTSRRRTPPCSWMGGTPRFFVPTHLALSGTDVTHLGQTPSCPICAEMRNVCALIDHEDDAAKIYHVRIAASPQISSGLVRRERLTIMDLQMVNERTGRPGVLPLDYQRT